MKDFYVHFCHHTDNILRRYDVSIIHSKGTGLGRYSELISTEKGILTMQKIYRDYLYNTFVQYNPYPVWNLMTVKLTSSLKEFQDNNIFELKYIEVNGKYFIYGFKALPYYENTITLYILST